MPIYRSKSKKHGVCYSVYKNNKHIATYSKNSFGIYVKKVAEMTLQDDFKYRNYFKLKKDGIIKMIIFSKKYGYKEILFNKSHFDEIKKYKWHVNKQDKTFYCNGKLNGGKRQYQFHRIVTSYNGKLQIDHIDRNGLNNLDRNLRIVTSSENQRNVDCKCKNTVWTNVSFKHDRFIVSWSTREGKRKTKLFKLSDKDDYNEVFNRAILFSIEKRNKHGYTLGEKDLKFISKNNIKL